MSYRPGDFLIGVSELISILLPGAAATYALIPVLGQMAVDAHLPQLEGAAAWVGAALVAYLTGHLIFLTGALLDRPYDLLRQRFYPRERDKTYLAATTVARSWLGADADATNTYKFATAVLALRHDTALAEVRQFEADSKFFRSLTILTVCLIVAGPLRLTTWHLLGGLVLLACCFWRYVERRWKATHRAFEYLMAIGHLDPAPTPTSTGAA
jgi:hypothetical protein